VDEVQLERKIGRVWESVGLKNRSKAIWRGAVDASGRFEAINSRGCAIAGATGVSAVQSDVALWLLVHAFQRLQIIHSDSLSGKLAALRACVTPRKHTHILSLSLSSLLAVRWNSSKQDTGRRTMPLNIYRSRGIEFCVDKRAIGPHELAWKRGHYDATKPRIGKMQSLSKAVPKNNTSRQKKREREREREIERERERLRSRSKVFNGKFIALVNVLSIVKNSLWIIFLYAQFVLSLITNK